MNKTSKSAASSMHDRNLIGAIDQGTSSTRFLVFDSDSGRLVASSQREIKRIVPKEGWVEMDPMEIIHSVTATIANVNATISPQAPKSFSEEQASSDQETNKLQTLKCVGICNQRESTVVWDKHSGRPLYNVIIWMDNRTKDIVDAITDSMAAERLKKLKNKTGLPMSTYFSAFKLKWLLDNEPEVRAALHEDRLMFGTVDTWILYNLTGNHYTDVTNASRTYLMDIETLEWDSELCGLFGIARGILPRILSSADDFGFVSRGLLAGVPITGMIGDQSAALFGHSCLRVGQTKATFGTGCFIMQNIGPGPVKSALHGLSREAKRGLVTTVAYKLRNKQACYALEGSIKIAGAALTWLRDNLQLISDFSECDELINKTTNSAGVFFVPALGGLYSPYWDPNASGLFIGLSQFSKREHLVRATLDSIAFQTNDILNLMKNITSGLMIDGGLCKSENMCQILADITGCEIVRPSMTETSALGAAMIAGHGAGVWPDAGKMLANSSHSQQTTHHYPSITLHHDDKFSLVHPTSPPQLSMCSEDAASQTVENEPACGIECDESENEDEDEDEADERLLFAEQPLSLHKIQMRSYQQLHPTPSSGYSSADNSDQATNSGHSQATTNRVHTPVSSQTVMSAPNLDELLDAKQDNIQGQEDDNARDGSQASPYPFCDFELDTSNNNNTKDCKVGEQSSANANEARDNGGGDIGVNDCDNALLSTDVRNDKPDLVPTSSESAASLADESPFAKTVDIFQSYISIEHRIELVNTWKLAVERSMKWTKSEQEEVKFKDSRASLTLESKNIYSICALGLLALGGLLSSRLLLFRS